MASGRIVGPFRQKYRVKYNTHQMSFLPAFGLPTAEDL